MIDEAFVQRFSSYFIVKSRPKYQNELQNRSQELYKCTQTTSFFIAMWLFLLTCICTIKYANHDVFVRFGWYKRLDEYALSVLILKTKSEPCIANKRMKMLEENRALQKKKELKENVIKIDGIVIVDKIIDSIEMYKAQKQNPIENSAMCLNWMVYDVSSRVLIIIKYSFAFWIRIRIYIVTHFSFLDSSLSAMNMLSFDSQPPLFQSQAHW